VLSDNIARTPAFGSSSYLNIPGVAVKTGTTNDYRDAWIVGYTPEISLAAWAGNNDNSSMEKKVAGFIVAPMWNEFMQFALTKKSPTSFSAPAGMDSGLKPIIAGNWNYTTDGVVHTILHWVDTSNPLGGDPRSPSSDSQYWLWENAVQAWQGNKTLEVVPEENTNEPQLQIINPSNGDVFSKKTEVYVAVQLNNTTSQIKEGTIKINGKKRGDLDTTTRSFLFIPDEISNIKDSGNTLEVEITDTTGNKFTDTITFGIN